MTRFCCAIFLACLCNFADAAKVSFVVAVPETTPPGETLRLAGSLAEVGNWNASGVALQRRADGKHTLSVDLPPGRTLEYKINRGDWNTVEKDADGNEIANRILEITADQTVEITVQAWSAGTPTTRPATVTGDLRLIEFKADAGTRTLRVWLPPGYEAAGDHRYPVLYMHDGQNCFDAATSSFGNEWKIDETLTELITEKQIEPIIVVAIDNTGLGRINEYTIDAAVDGVGGKGDGYARMLIEQIKPMIDQSFRTRPGRESTIVGGSSLGGIISLDIGRLYPEHVGAIIAMSPSLWWNKESPLKRYTADVQRFSATRIWVDMGAKERPDFSAVAYVDQARRLSDLFEKSQIRYRYEQDPDGQHDEPAWAGRFPQAIQFILQSER